ERAAARRGVVIGEMRRLVRFVLTDFELDRLVAGARRADDVAGVVLDLDVVDDLTGLANGAARDLGAETVAHALQRSALPGPGGAFEVQDPARDRFRVGRLD